MGPVRVDALASAHERIERDERAAAGTSDTWCAWPWRIYHSGDTVRYAGMAERLREHAPDVALLPINGRDPARGVAGNLDGPEAATLARDAGAGLVVPCHYEGFAFNTASPEPFREACEALGQPYRVLRAGERLQVARR